MQVAAQQQLRTLIWWFYADLKAYRVDPSPRRRSELRTRFERIFQISFCLHVYTNERRFWG